MKYKKCPHCSGSTTCKCSTCGTAINSTDSRGSEYVYYQKGMCKACNGMGEVVDNRPEQPPSSSSCFIATTVYGENHKNVAFLRNFRDLYLYNSNIGRKFIELYYKYSPQVSDFIRDKTIIKLFFKYSLEAIIMIIKLIVRKN